MRQSVRCYRWLVGSALAVMLVAAPETHQSRVDAADQASINQAVARAAAYLRERFKGASGGRRVLAAYALYKSGSPVNSPEVASVLEEVLARFDGETYRPGVPSEAPYQAGVEAMLLADIDPVKYRPQLQAIANHLIETRLSVNVWDYKGETSPGDTSVTQYGCLGLWAAARAGVDIPNEVWDKIMLWHFRSHREDGGFTYMPGTTTGPGGGQSTLNMTAGAIGSMSIAALYLFPNQSERNQGFAGPKKPAQEDPSGLKFGILEKELPPEPESDAANGVTPSRPKGPYKVESSYAEYRQHTQRALGWLGANFQVQNRIGPAMYYYYALERMGALTNVDKLGQHDWYHECADFLLKQQLPEGSWNLSIYDANGPYMVGTSFGILFLTRSTAKLLNRLPRTDLVGGGLLIGGRGLPDDLTQVELADGRVESRKPSGPLDELLAQLAKSGGDDLFELQEGIVEKIQLGDRSELVGKTEQLVKLVDHRDPQVRRTALWALGRSNDLKLVRHAIRALLDDPDVDVLIEAHNALSWFARRPDGLGLADHPLAGLAPDASEESRAVAVRKWREDAVRAWGQWYLRVCPYEERDDPFVVSLKRRTGKRP